MTGALFAFLAASFRSVKWLISVGRSTTHRRVFTLESYLLTLGILPQIPLLHKLKQLYKRLPVGFLIDIAYTANNILYKLYTKMAVYF